MVRVLRDYDHRKIRKTLWRTRVCENVKLALRNISKLAGICKHTLLTVMKHSQSSTLWQLYQTCGNMAWNANVITSQTNAIFTNYHVILLVHLALQHI